MIVRVGHIQAVSSHAQTAGLIEAGRFVPAAGLAVAGEGLDCESVGVAELDLVVVGIGDEELASAVGQAGGRKQGRGAETGTQLVCRQPSIDGLTSGSHIRERDEE